MKKPSERIEELTKLYGRGVYMGNGITKIELDPNSRMNALIEYLDEQWEAKQEENCKCENFKKCGHKVWRNYQGAWGGSTPPPQKECVNCGITI